ncbi:MAG: hydantoinase/oxoprolinase family protein [Acidimicrobiia bacterium]
MLNIGIDIGGTFTDGYLSNGPESFGWKVPTYRFDLNRSVVLCLRQGAELLGKQFRNFLEEIDVLRLATTVGTNAIIEGSGSRVGVLVEAGQEELLYGRVPNPALFQRFLDPTLVRGITDPLVSEQVLLCTRQLVDFGVRQIVVSLPLAAEGVSKEKVIETFVRDRYPEHYLRSVPLKLGTDVTSCRDDHVRTSTAIVNAYLHRDVDQLLHSAEDELRSNGMRKPVLVVHANSGAARISKSTAIGTYGSGPSAGLSGAEAIARLYGDELVLTVDMGGTTLDIGVVVGGKSETQTRSQIAGVEVALAMNRTESIGCGGSSLAWLDGDAILLGPRSAGATPGPAAFGLGGKDATLTDADLLVGLLTDESMLGNQFVLSAEAAREAIAKKIAGPLEKPEVVAACGIEAAATESIVSALRETLGSRGFDPAAVTVYIFGGAGPLHLSAPMSKLGLRRARSFPSSSVFSAFGATVVDIRHTYETAWAGSCPTMEQLTAHVGRLLAKGLADVRAEGFGAGDAKANTILRGSDGAELRVLGHDQALDELGQIEDVANRAIDWDQWPQVEVIAVEIAIPIAPFQPAPLRHGRESTGPIGKREVWWGTERLSTEVYRWADLSPGAVLDGPLLVEATDTTHAVGPGWRVSMTEYGDMLWEST